MAEIKQMSIKHHAILDFLLENPDMSRREVAAHFGVTQAWLSTITNSDAFLAELAERRSEISSTIAADMPTRIRSLGAQGIDRLEEQFATGLVTPAMALEVVQMAIKAEGLGQPKQAPLPGVNAQNVNFFNVTPDLLANAREKMLNPPSLRVTKPDEAETRLIESSDQEPA